MSLLEKIKETIYNEYRVHTSGDNFILDEPNINATCKIAKFSKNGGNVIAYKFDKVVDLVVKHKKGSTLQKIDNLFPFFNDIEGLKAMADYILFYEKANGKYYAIICNMKSKNLGNNDNQFAATKFFVDFIVKNIERTHKIQFEIDFIRKVLFADKVKIVYTKAYYEKKKRENDFTWHYLSNTDTITTCNLQHLKIFCVTYYPKKWSKNIYSVFFDTTPLLNNSFTVAHSSAIMLYIIELR